MAKFNPDGWLDVAIRRPGPMAKTSGLRDSTDGVVYHSAVGYEAGMMAVLDGTREASWHLSNMQDGRILQHYAIGVKAWHANQENGHLVGMEQEGGPEGNTREPLTGPQIDNCATVAAALMERYGWPALARSGSQKSLWEHNEIVATACPSGRIPWDIIIERAREGEVTSEEFEAYQADIERRRKVESWFTRAASHALVGEPLPGWLSRNLKALLAAS